MSRMNHSTRRLALVALTALTVAHVRPAGATYRTLAELRAGPPVLEGARLGVTTRLEALERCRVLGFGSVLRERGQDGLVAVTPLKVGRIEWSIETDGEWALLDTRTAQPLTVPSMYFGTRWVRPDPRGGDPRVVIPNHAVRVVGLIGIVSDMEAAVAALQMPGPQKYTPVSLHFGDPFLLPDLDGIARESSIGSGWARLIAPRSADSPCAAWRRPGFGRWIGIVLESDDLHATARWFDDNGVPWRVIDRGTPGIAVDPDHTGGVLIEFVSQGYRPQL